MISTTTDLLTINQLRAELKQVRADNERLRLALAVTATAMEKIDSDVDGMLDRKYRQILSLRAALKCAPILGTAKFAQTYEKWLDNARRVLGEDAT